MAKQQRQMEGDANQRRAAAREAKAAGKKPSEVGATLGASKQTKKAPKSASHQERLEQKREGKHGQKASGDEARPGNRDEDPKRESGWG